MSAEKSVRDAWAAFVKATEAAVAAGLDISLPNTIKGSIVVSETGRFRQEAAAPVASPPPSPSPPQAPAADSSTEENEDPPVKPSRFSRKFDRET